METDFSKRLKKKQKDKSDFSTDKKKKDLSDFAGKNKIKTNTSKMKNTFSSDAGVKPKASSGKTTFSADTNIAKISSKAKDKSDFAGSNKTKTKTKTKTSTNKPRIVSKKELKASGLSLRDFLNKERGLTRKDGKKVVKKVVKKSSPPKAPPPAPNRGKKKIISSLKVSRSGIDGGASQVNKAKKKVVKKSALSTKTPKFFKGTNITPTKLQRDRMRKRRMAAT